MKLPMSDSEIARRYRNALNPKKSIRILAELNAATTAEIRAALAREGILPGASALNAQSRSYKRLDQQKMRELYDQGMNDQEIAAQLGASAGGVYAWRYRNRLPANDTTGFHPRKGKGVGI